MELKRYQKNVLRDTKTFLDALAEFRKKGEKRPSMDAWAAATGSEFYKPRKDGLGRDLPVFCIKVPTGGGKTLLATQILGQIYSTILRHRNGGGLALWIVPSDQIYKDTLKALRDRRHFYRESLEHAMGRRIEIWEKDEIHRVTPGQIRDNLNILMLKLASANRETKEQLRMFQDSGGNIVQHFPAEDAAEAQRALKQRIGNLDMISEDLAKTSLANLIRLCEPPVILDEGHKAYSELAQKTLETFNASILVELSATPPEASNVLCRVGGPELLAEEMIKLPINIAMSGEENWKTLLGRAKEKRDDLSRKAEQHFDKGGRLIRPIVLVQVERVGKDQRESKFIHSEDVKEYLIHRLGVAESEIAIKTSEKDDIEGMDLLAEGCRIGWIITKQALQEGWDCPFAYILVSLNNTQSELSMTQLVGRVLRQPYAKKTGLPDLDESYVFCLKKKAGQILNEIKAALQKEGYEGDDASVRDASGDADENEPQKALFRREIKRLYKDFEGKIYLPRFCVRDGKSYEGLDYYRHLVREVDVNRFDYPSVNWDLTNEFAQAKEIFFKVTLGQDGLRAEGKKDVESWEPDDRVRAWLTANLPYEHFSHRELRRVVDAVLDRLPKIQAKLGLLKFILRDKLAGFIETGTDEQTEAAFRKLLKQGRLCFYLECVRCRFQIPESVTLKSLRRLVHQDTNAPVERSLFDTVSEASFNEYEKEVALFIDRHPEVLWWYRNAVGKDAFAIQGYLKNKIYPDFVVQKGTRKKPSPTVLVVETKGSHLEGDRRTSYTRDLAKAFEELGRQVSWQELGKGFDESTFRFQVLPQGEHQAWKDDLKRLLAQG